MVYAIAYVIEYVIVYATVLVTRDVINGFYVFYFYYIKNVF